MSGDQEVEAAVVEEADDGGVADADVVQRTKLLTPSRLSVSLAQTHFVHGQGYHM